MDIFTSLDLLSIPFIAGVALMVHWVKERSWPLWSSLVGYGFAAFVFFSITYLYVTTFRCQGQRSDVAEGGVAASCPAPTPAEGLLFSFGLGLSAVAIVVWLLAQMRKLDSDSSEPTGATRVYPNVPPPPRRRSARK